MHVDILKIRDSAMNLTQIKKQVLEMGLSKKEIRQLSKSELIRYIQKNTNGVGCFGLNHKCQDFHCVWFKVCTRESYKNYKASINQK